MEYRKVASSTPVYYSILNSFVQRSQYISIKFPLHLKILKCATNQDSLLLATLRYELLLIWPSLYILQFAKTYHSPYQFCFTHCQSDWYHVWKICYEKIITFFRHWSQIMIFILVGGPPKLITVKLVQQNFWQPQRPKVYGNK